MLRDFCRNMNLEELKIEQLVEVLPDICDDYVYKLEKPKSDEKKCTS